jgi:hypothetical protein
MVGLIEAYSLLKAGFVTISPRLEAWGGLSGFSWGLTLHSPVVSLEDTVGQFMDGLTPHPKTLLLTLRPPQNVIPRLIAEVR